MNKTELVNAIAEEAKLTKVQAKAALEAALCAVGGALAKGDKVALIGFGTFGVVLSPQEKWLNSKLVLNSQLRLNKLLKQEFNEIKVSRQLTRSLYFLY